MIPDRSYPPADEREILAIYDFSDTGPRPVRIPASDDGLSILLLRTEPPGLRETFAAGRRYVHPRGDRLILRCRYRACQHQDADGAPRPLPTPRDLFPGATELRTVRHHDAWSSG